MKHLMHRVTMEACAPEALPTQPPGVSIRLFQPIPSWHCPAVELTGTRACVEAFVLDNWGADYFPLGLTPVER